MVRAMEPPVLAADASIPREEGATPARAWIEALRRERLLLGVALAYVAAVGLICLALGKTGFFHPFVYMKMWIAGLVMVVGAYALAVEMPRALKADPRSPMTAFAARVRRHLTPSFAAGLALFMAAGLFTGAFTTMKSLINGLAPFWADGWLADLDAALHLGVDPWRLLQPLLGHEPVTRLIQHLYLGGWATMLVGFTAAAALSPRLAHVRTRFFLIYFGSWILIGNALAAVFMSGGPVYFGALTGDGARFGDQVRYLAFSAEAHNSSVQLQQALWQVYRSGEYHMGTGISAFPSMHVAMMTLFTLTAFELDRRLGWAVAAFAAVILAGSVHLAWHYAIDGYFSIAVVALAWLAMGRLAARRAA